MWKFAWVTENPRQTLG